MHAIHSIAALRSTLQYTKSSTIPSDHKVLLIALLTEALRHQQEQDTKSAALENAAKPWQEADSAMVRSSLAGKVATSWQHADEMLALLVAKLGRESQSQYVRSRAIELGVGAGVDFRLARVLIAERAHAADERDVQANG